MPSCMECQETRAVTYTSRYSSGNLIPIIQSLRIKCPLECLQLLVTTLVSLLCFLVFFLILLLILAGTAIRGLMIVFNAATSLLKLDDACPKIHLHCHRS